MTEQKNTPYEKWNRVSFKMAYEEANETAKRMQAQRDEARGNLATIEKRNTELKQQFDDLKQRLHAAETSNQFMRGYLARVQEDDAEREDLVKVGDPDGECQLVPKRKSTSFPRPDDFSLPRPSDEFGMSYGDRIASRDRKPKHWITY